MGKIRLCEKLSILSYLDPIEIKDQKKGGKKPGSYKTGTPVGKTPEGSDVK